MRYSIGRFEKIVDRLDAADFRQLAETIRDVVRARRIERPQIYDELVELAALSGVSSEAPPARDASDDKENWVQQQIADVGRARTGRQAARFLRWMYFYAQPQIPAPWRDRLGLPSTGDHAVMGVALNSVGPASAVPPDDLSNGLDRLIALGGAKRWAQLVDVTNRFEMRGLGAAEVPKFALGSYLQIHIEPPIEGFVSLFNLDRPRIGPNEVFLLDPLIFPRDLVAYPGEQIVLPAATTGLPLGGLEGTSSILVICISGVSVFDLWGEHFRPGEAFTPDEMQLRQFSRRVVATDIRSRAISTLAYQS